MREVIALETEICGWLPAADAAAAALDASASIHATIRDAHDILCNAWRNPGERRERLRDIAAELRGFCWEHLA